VKSSGAAKERTEKAHRGHQRRQAHKLSPGLRQREVYDRGDGKAPNHGVQPVGTLLSKTRPEGLEGPWGRTEDAVAGKQGQNGEKEGQDMHKVRRLKSPEPPDMEPKNATRKRRSGKQDSCTCVPAVGRLPARKGCRAEGAAGLNHYTDLDQDYGEISGAEPDKRQKGVKNSSLRRKNGSERQRRSVAAGKPAPGRTGKKAGDLQVGKPPTVRKKTVVTASSHRDSKERVRAGHQKGGGAGITKGGGEQKRCESPRPEEKSSPSLQAPVGPELPPEDEFPARQKKDSNNRGERG